MSRSGEGPRPRYGRIAAFVAAASTTAVALVGSLVAEHPLPPAARSAGAALSSTSTGMATGTVTGSATGSSTGSATGSATGTSTGSATGAATGSGDSAADAALATAPSTAVRAALSVGLPPLGSALPTPSEPEQVGDDLPGDSGTGRRVVFSESQQRVWLVADDEEVARTYLVSGSIYDNLDPGSYQVYSRSRTATGIDGSDLRYMVRFTQGDNAAIGFHSIPRMNGRRMQTRAELGTPLSHGCVRQALPDAQALWRFAPVGTAVVVTA